MSFLVLASLARRAIVCFNRAFSISRQRIRVLSPLLFCEMIAESTNTLATILLTFVFLRTPAFVRASSEASEFGGDYLKHAKLEQTLASALRCRANTDREDFPPGFSSDLVFTPQIHHLSAKKHL